MARATPRRQVGGNLPAEVTSFVNRRAEVAQTRRLLGYSRLVTLTGPGGVGKTRLALRAARGMGGSFPDGVWFVDLAPLQSRALVAHTVAQALGISDPAARRPVDVLLGYLRSKRLLLVLDNCERVSTECADLASTLLRADPGLRILVTSRQSLGIPGEHIMTVAPLEAPAPEWMGSFRVRPEHHAVALFIERARAVDPEFAVTPENEMTLAHVCHQLDGIPLAIELAAARLRLFPLGDLAARLGGGTRLLIPARQARGGRHRTLHATLSWSFELCTEPERKLWARASVFSGGFDLSAAEHVCADGDIPPEQVMDLVAGLVEKSILIRQEHGGQVRYRLLDTVRQFGLERLRQTGEEDALRRRHRDWYLGLAERGNAEWFGPHEVEWSTRLRLEHANLRAALNFCLSSAGEIRSGLRMATTLWFYWLAYGFVAEGCHWIERALELDREPTGERVRALWVDGYMAAFQGANPAAMKVLEESDELARRLGDESALAYVTQILGLAALGRGDVERADALLTEAQARHRSLGQFDAIVAVGHVMIAYAAAGRGDFDRAVALSHECREISEAHGDIWVQSWAVWLLSLVEWFQGQAPEAAQHARECLRIKQVFHDVLGMAFALEMLAWTAAAEGATERAATLLGAAESTWLTMGEPMAGAPQLIESHERSEAGTRSAMGDRAFEETFKRGMDFDIEEAADYALAGTGAAPG